LIVSCRGATGSIQASESASIQAESATHKRHPNRRIAPNAGGMIAIGNQDAVSASETFSGQDGYYEWVGSTPITFPTH
jgi:hypothetical protein